MIYRLTDKLNFDENPQIEVKGEVLTVQSDAENVLKVMDAVNEGNVAGIMEAASLLFSPADMKKIRKFKFQFADYAKLINVAVSLALGEDPDEESGE